MTARRGAALGGAMLAVLALVWLGGLLLALPVLGLLGLVGRVAWPHTPRGRLRREHGRDGWATLRQLWEVRPTGPSTEFGTTTVGPPVPVRVRVADEDSVGILGGVTCSTGSSSVTGSRSVSWSLSWRRRASV